MTENIYTLLFFCFFSLNLLAQEETPDPQSRVSIHTEYNTLAPLFNQQDDTVRVINFWATWCQPCVAELPHFTELYERYENSKVQLHLVSLDFPKTIETKLIPFVEKYQLKPPVYALTDMDYNSWIDKIDPEWDGAIPFTVIYRGDKRKFIRGEISDMKELDKVVQQFLQ